MTDLELVQAIRGGDEAASRRFDALYRPRLYKSAVYVLGWQDPEAEDAVQETFAAAFPQLDRYDPSKASLYTWLSGICVKMCFKRIKKRRRLVLQEEQDIEIKLIGSASAQVFQNEEADENSQKIKLLKKAMETLESPCRAILDLRHSQGESYAVMAEKMKLPIGTIMSRLHRCRETLKKQVEQAQRGDS